MEPITLIDRGVYTLNGWYLVVTQFNSADPDQRLYSQAHWTDLVRGSRTDMAPDATFDTDGMFVLHGQRHHASELRYTGGRADDPTPDRVRRFLPDRVKTFTPGVRQSLQTVARAGESAEAVRAYDPAGYWRPIG